MSEFAEDERYTRQLHGVSFVNKDEIDGEEESEWFDIGFVEAETESMRQEAEIRLRTQSNNLKRFHDKICMRVTARERQNRLEAQRAQKHLDEKCAKVFSTTEATPHTGNTVTKQVSTGQHFRKMKEDKTAIPKDCPLGKHIEKILHADAQIRDDLLRSTEISRSHNFSNYEKTNNESESAGSPLLLPEQRVALYATVRRQYMEMNRAKVQNNVWRHPSNSNKVKSPLSNTSVAAAVSGSRTRRTEERWAAVKIIDMTAGCEMRVHRQATTSSTPWRKKSAKKGPPRQTATTEHERFLRALQAQIGAPALCSCGKIGPNSTCANNCALYKQPKKREKLLTSVYKQQQQEGTPNAASPIR